MLNIENHHFLWADKKSKIIKNEIYGTTYTNVHVGRSTISEMPEPTLDLWQWLWWLLQENRLSNLYLWFGPNCWAYKCRVFHTPILVQPDFIDIIVKSCCILHSFVRKRDLVYRVYKNAHFESIDNFGTGFQGKGSDIRNNFADYFMGPRAVSFQKNYMFLWT